MKKSTWLDVASKRSIHVFKGIIAVYLLSVSSMVLGQSVDLNNIDDKFKKKNLIKLNGGLSAGLIGYAGNSEGSRNPYTWNVSGNVNVKLFDLINLPVSLNISNANRELKVPNTPTRLSISPTFKAFTFHAGDVNLVYSPYTLNGHQFTGGGIDVAAQKGKWKDYRISAMGGRMQQAVEFDSLQSNSLAAYERWGYGGKFQYVKKAFEAGINIFTAKDRINSLFIAPDAIGVKPQQNIVGSLDLALRPFKGFEFKVEYARSALTSDLRDSSEDVERINGIFNGIFPVNNSTAYYTAQKMEFNYQMKKTIIGMAYENIDPGYRTLGAYFFANDLENITMNLGRVFFDNKLNLNLRGGLQRDDLDGKKSGTNQRFVGAFNVNFTPGEKFNLSADYSNFRTYMRVKSQFQFINQLNQYQSLDTFNFTQISENVNTAMTLRISDKPSSSQSVMLNLSLQRAYAEQAEIEMKDANNLFYNASIGHMFEHKKTKFSLTTTYFTTVNQISNFEFITHGPSLNLSKKLIKDKISLSAGLNYNLTTSSNAAIPDTEVLNLRAGANATLWKKHNFMLSVMQQSAAARTNQIGNLMYQFSF